MRSWKARKLDGIFREGQQIYSATIIYEWGEDAYFATKNEIDCLGDIIAARELIEKGEVSDFILDWSWDDL